VLYGRNSKGVRERHAQGRYSAMWRPGVEPTTYWWSVLTTTLPIHKISHCKNSNSKWKKALRDANTARWL